MQIKTTPEGTAKILLTKHEKRSLVLAQIITSRISKNDDGDQGTAAAQASDNLTIVIDGLEGSADTAVSE